MNAKLGCRLWVLRLCLALGCGVGALAAADDGENAVRPEFRELMQKYAAVKEWQGVWEVSIDEDTSQPWREGDHEDHIERRSHGSFLLKQNMKSWSPKSGSLAWKGDGEASGRISRSYVGWSYSFGYPVGAEGDENYEGVTQMTGHVFRLSFPRLSDKPEGRVSYSDGSHAKPAHGIITRRWVTPEHDFPRGKEGNDSQPSDVPIPAWLNLNKSDNSPENWSVVAGGPGLLVFRCDSLQEKQAPGSNSFALHRRSRLMLIPAYDNLEVEVTIADYDAWRPKGTIADPKKPGNKLAVRAMLKTKDGAPTEPLPPVSKITFELIDTSREPGICLNWPLNAEDNDPDLRLAAAAMGGELSKEDQKLIVKNVPRDEQDRPYAEAQVDSYDFGGQSELRVTCELEDGREIVGLLQDGKGGKDLVRLPKMDGPGWIAESWRKAHGVPNLPDSDDNEKVEGQDYKGDGFTLYEEYRGFVENGVHVEGDPKKKDFFILNLADVATRDGISLLEQVAKLKAHARLRDGKEMTQEARLMNGNHRAGPHHVDQHGVVLSHVGMGKGGYTANTPGADGQKASRPGTVSLVYIEPPDSVAGLFSRSVLNRYGLDHLDPVRLYAAAVAHELAHAVGADHHGERRMELRWGYFQSADNPRNPTGKPRFTAATGSPKELLALWEDSGESVAFEQQALFNDYVTKAAAGQQQAYRDAAEYWCNRPFFVGPAKDGTDSGGETCLMAYYFATAYESPGSKDRFYVIRPGSKQVETQLCTNPAGTGGNAPSHSPKPRFGDAAGGRGDCFGAICPNDAIPPRNITIK